MCAIYKPSNANPSLSEIDVTQANTFSTQVNTSGEPIRAYKFTVMSGDASDTIYEGTTTDLTTPVKNKKMLEITSASQTGLSLVNGKDYQWGVRTYNALKNSTTQPNTLVCNGYTVGSTKYVTWVNIPDHGEGGANQDAVDNIVYDRYIEYSVSSADSLLIGGHEPDTKAKPTGITALNPYVQRRKINWVDKELGTDKDFIKIETEKTFDYDYIDGTPFTIYQCSSEHTVTSAFADPNSNINVSNYVLIYADAAAALAAFTSGEKPGGSTTTALYGGAKKITGYSSDTGEIRVHDAWTEAPKNGNVYRVFKQDVSTKLFEELFSSNIQFATDYTDSSKNKYYGTTIYATSENKVAYYSDTSLTTKVGDLITSTACNFVTPTYSTISRGSTPYYVATPAGGTLTQNYDAINVNGVYGNIIIGEITYAIPYSSLIPKVKGVSVNPFTAQAIGGIPITDATYYKSYSNHWGSTAADKRLFIQPNINIKTDDTNPNEIVFDSTGARLDIIKQTTTNPTSGKTIDITFNKLDNSQWLLEGDAIGNLVGTLPLVNTSYINPQTDYKVYTDFMDSAPLNLFYARLTPTITIQCRNYYQTLKTSQGQAFPFTNQYYIPEGGMYYQNNTCTDLADGSFVYLPAGEAYYTTYSIGAGFGGDVAYLTSPITEASEQAVYKTNVCTEVTIGGTVYYAHTPSYKTKSDTICNWTVGDSTGTITDENGIQRWVKVASIHENPSIYMNMPSELYKQVYGLTFPEYDYRDFEFNTVVTFTNNQQVKYYNYELYVKNTSGIFELIEQSEDIYSTDVEWHFRGFERGESKNNPKEYKVIVNITDSYDKTFSAEQVFGIYYPIEQAVVPLDINYDCHEKGITISVRDPLYVKSTDLAVGGHSTVTTANFYETGNEIQYLYIPEDKVLNYTNVDNEEETPIFIPAKSELLTQFQIRGEFIESIPNAGENVILQLANEYTKAEYTAGLQSGVSRFNNLYNNNVRYTEIIQQPVYTPSTYTAEFPTDIIMYPDYYQCVVAQVGDSIFIKGTEGVKYYSDTACTIEVGTIDSDIYAIYTDAAYSNVTIDSTIYHVKNNRIESDIVITDGIANTIIRYNRIKGTVISGETVGSLLADNDVKTYLQGIISSITPSIGDDVYELIKNADNDTATSGNKIIYGITALNNSTRFNETEEETLKNEIKEFLNRIYYITNQNELHKTVNKNAYLETYTLTMTDVNTYYYDEVNKVYVRNTNNVGALKLYRNEDMFHPLTCFEVNGTLVNNYSIKDNIPGVVVEKQLRYALQRTEGFEFCTASSSYQGKLPLTGIAGKYYVIYEEYSRAGVTYKPGLYLYSNGNWELDISYDYIIVSNKNQLPIDMREHPENISNAVGIYDTVNDAFIWCDLDDENKPTAWIENSNADLTKVKEAFDELWLTLFTVWDYTATAGREVVCTIKSSKGGKL